MRFGPRLYVGMTDVQAKTLRDSIREPHPEDESAWNKSQTIDEYARGDYTRDVDYLTWGTFCIEGGTRYTLHFNRSGYLQSWTGAPFSDGC